MKLYRTRTYGTGYIRHDVPKLVKHDIRGIPRLYGYVLGYLRYSFDLDKPYETN